MQIIIICTLAFLAASQAQEFVLQHHGLPPVGPPQARAATPVWGTITQKLDNFDSNNNATWSMRYLSNDQFFKPGGPIFLMIGAEWTIGPGYLQNGQMYDMAKQNNAYMFYTEHRYYGKSFPTADVSPANLAYLTTPQALADLDYFVKDRKENIAGLDTSKVVVFGGSYAGNMATWFREKYPNTVHAALASSAPILAKADFTEYFEVVQTSLANPACYGVISNAMALIDFHLMSGVAGIAKVQTDFNLCGPVNVDDFYDKAFFYNSIANTFANIVQSAKGNTIQNTCNELMNPSLPDDYSRLSQFILNKRPKCIGNYNNYVTYYASWDRTRGDSRKWIYQTCTEYGFFQTATSDRQPFINFPVELYYGMCRDIFGQTYDSARVNNGVAASNLNYGGLNPNITRVVSVHGLIDPWHALGLTADLSDTAPVIIVPGTSHCADLKSLSDNDSAEMRSAKIRVQNYISTWLSQE